jgi:hypothetical protein
MTANQLYKIANTEEPFNQWIDEQKNIYGEDFLQNPEAVQDILDLSEEKEKDTEEDLIEDEVLDLSPTTTSVSKGLLSRTNIVFGLLVLGAGFYIYRQYKASK